MDYAEFVLSRAKPGADILPSMTAEKLNLWHHATGASTETGELLDAVKKHVIYDKPLDKQNVLEECGDILFYVTGMLAAAGYSLQQAVDHNVSKLMQRFPNGYTNAAAQARADKVAEMAGPQQPQRKFIGQAGTEPQDPSRSQGEHREVLQSAGVPYEGDGQEHGEIMREIIR